MANNPYVNKVQLADGTSLIDISDSTVVASDVSQGKYFYLATGEKVAGTATGGGSGDGYVWQDAQGYVHLSDEEGTQISVQRLDVNASGTYTAPSRTAYSPVVVPSGTAGTPSASKSAVSNHSVTVTPSVTNTAGYISGGTKTGTGVSVSASELVSGAKSISANGTDIDVTNYASVDVAVPTGSATLITKSITANGTYNASSDSADGYSSVTVNVDGGGGTTPAPKKQINFIDYDGTILYSYTKTEWQSVSTLSSNPSHTGLTAQGWNWTKAQIDAQLTALPDGDVWVGQMYITDDGKTRIYIHLEEGRLHPYLGICPNGTVVVDWGDNSATDTLSGNSKTTVKCVDHTYSSGGNYIITLTVSSGSFRFYGVSGAAYILRKLNSTTSNIHTVYACAVRRIELGTGAEIGNYAFKSCGLLSYITIPREVTSLGDYAFNDCMSLASITIPSEITSINAAAFNACYSLSSVAIPGGLISLQGNVFQSCYSLETITIPIGVTSLGNSSINGCRGLVKFYIPNSVTNLGSYAFSGCHSLAIITVPNGITTIEASTFYSCYGMSEYHFLSTTPPTLANTNAFTNIQSDCKIYVPAESLEAYQTATNWSTYASYMVGE